jgi:hypothetical protein
VHFHFFAFLKPSEIDKRFKKQEEDKENGKEEENSLPDSHFRPAVEWIVHQSPHSRQKR